nr:hypothetical protein [Klebsiella pneumoniae]
MKLALTGDDFHWASRRITWVTLPTGCQNGALASWLTVTMGARYWRFGGYRGTGQQILFAALSLRFDAISDLLALGDAAGGHARRVGSRTRFQG